MLKSSGRRVTLNGWVGSVTYFNTPSLAQVWPSPRHPLQDLGSLSHYRASSAPFWSCLELHQLGPGAVVGKPWVIDLATALHCKSTQTSHFLDFFSIVFAVRVLRYSYSLWISGRIINGISSACVLKWALGLGWDLDCSSCWVLWC